MSFTITYPSGSGGGGGPVDAADVTYTPTDAGDWNNVPDNAEAALDDLAATDQLLSTAISANIGRLNDLESDVDDILAWDADNIPYTPTTGSDWDGPPAEVEGALDELAGRLQAIEDLGTPAALLTWATTTGALEASETVNLNMPLPTGITMISIQAVIIERTSGTSDSIKLAYFRDDARTDNNTYRFYLFGGEFDSATLSSNPLLGPMVKFSGQMFNSPIPVHYQNVDGSEFMRLTFTNSNLDEGEQEFDITIKYFAIG